MARPGGGYSPRASDIDVTIDGGSSKEIARVTEEDGSSLAFTWPEKLPDPEVEGGVATYKVSEDADLLVTVTGSGTNARIRLNEAPSTEDKVFKLGLRSDGMNIAQSSTGALKALDESGDIVATTTQLSAWDASRDAGGDPNNIVPLDAELDTKATTGGVSLHELTLSPPDGFLTDPTTVYPVIIDPDITFEKTRDTWVRNGTEAKGSSPFLFVGRQDPSSTSNVNPSRAYLKFYNGIIEDNTSIDVVSAELGLWQYYGFTCDSRVMDVLAVSTAWSNSMTWGNRAGTSGIGSTSVSGNRGASGCADGWTKIDVTDIAKAWSAARVDMQGVRLSAANETTYTAERRFCSMDPDSSTVCNLASRRPYLEVTYNNFPNQATDPSVSVLGSRATVSAVVSDSDTKSRAKFTISKAGNVVHVGFSEYVEDGEVAEMDVPPLADGTYQLTVRSNDGLLDSKLSTAPISFEVDSTDLGSYGGFMNLGPIKLVDTSTGLALPQQKIAGGGNKPH